MGRQGLQGPCSTAINTMYFQGYIFIAKACILKDVCTWGRGGTGAFWHLCNELKDQKQWRQGPFSKDVWGGVGCQEPHCLWGVLFFFFLSFLACGWEKGRGGRQPLCCCAGCQTRYRSIVLNILITLQVKEPCGACSGVRVKNEQRHHAWAGGGCLPASSAGLQCIPAIETRFEQGGGLVAFPFDMCI